MPSNAPQMPSPLNWGGCQQPLVTVTSDDVIARSNLSNRSLTPGSMVRNEVHRRSPIVVDFHFLLYRFREANGNCSSANTGVHHTYLTVQNRTSLSSNKLAFLPTAAKPHATH
jgi:hypothetical protein